MQMILTSLVSWKEIRAYLRKYMKTLCMKNPWEKERAILAKHRKMVARDVLVENKYSIARRVVV